MIVDLSRVSLIDASIINAFIAVYRNAEETGVRYRVSHPRPASATCSTWPPCVIVALNGLRLLRNSARRPARTLS